jgi:hypothetical protein
MIKRIAAVVALAFAGLALAGSPSFAADEPATCDTLTADPDAMFGYQAIVVIPEGSYVPEFCEVYGQHVPADSWIYHYTYHHENFLPTSYYGPH